MSPRGVYWHPHANSIKLLEIRFLEWRSTPFRNHSSDFIPLFCFVLFFFNSLQSAFLSGTCKAQVTGTVLLKKVIYHQTMTYALSSKFNLISLIPSDALSFEL